MVTSRVREVGVEIGIRMECHQMYHLHTTAPGSTDGNIIITDHPYDVSHRHNTTLHGAHELILTVLADSTY